MEKNKVVTRKKQLYIFQCIIHIKSYIEVRILSRMLLFLWSNGQCRRILLCCSSPCFPCSITIIPKLGPFFVEMPMRHALMNDSVEVVMDLAYAMLTIFSPRLFCGLLSHIFQEPLPMQQLTIMPVRNLYPSSDNLCTIS